MSVDLSPYADFPVKPFRHGETDVREYLVDVHRAVIRSGRAQTLILGDLLSDQTAEVSATRREVKGVADQLEGIRNSLDWGFTLLHDQLERESRQLDELIQVVRKLLHASRNVAQAAFQDGVRDRRRGLLAKALEKFKKAEAEDDVDFLLQLQIGKLYLYGVNEEESVFDLVAAERHLKLAHRYARAAKIDLGERVTRYTAEACYHLSVLAYLQSSHAARQGDTAHAEEYLRTAVTWLESSPSLLPHHRYQRARCHALLGNEVEVVEELLNLADKDRSFVYRALAEPDFSGFSEQIRTIPEQARATPGPASAAAYEKRERAIAAVKAACGDDPLGALREEAVRTESFIRDREKAFEQGEITATEFRKTSETVSGRWSALRLSVLRAHQGALTACVRNELSATNEARGHLQELVLIIPPAIAAVFIAVSATAALALVDWLVRRTSSFGTYLWGRLPNEPSIPLIVGHAGFGIFVTLTTFLWIQVRLLQRNARAKRMVAASDERIATYKLDLARIEQKVSTVHTQAQAEPTSGHSGTPPLAAYKALAERTPKMQVEQTGLGNKTIGLLAAIAAGVTVWLIVQIFGPGAFFELNHQLWVGITDSFR